MNESAWTRSSDEGEEAVLEAQLRQRGPGREGHAEAVDHERRRELARRDADLQVLQVGDPVDQPVDEGVQRPLVEGQGEPAPADLEAARPRAAPPAAPPPGRSCRLHFTADGGRRAL